MYIFTLLLLATFALLEAFNSDFVRKNQQVLVFIAFSMLVFHDGFRWETGSDWYAYYDFFDNFFLFDDYSLDAGYVLLVFLIRSITADYTVFLVVYALIFYGLFFHAIFKISAYPFMALLLFYAATVPYLGMNRQFIAVALCFVGLAYYLNGRKALFYLLLLVAFFFHKTCLMFLLIPFLGKRFPWYIYASSFSVVLIIALSGIINRIPPAIFYVLGDDMREKIDFYVATAEDVSLVTAAISLARKLIWIAVLWFYDSKIKNKGNSFHTLFNMYFIGCLFYVLFSNTIFQVFVARALMYYDLASIFLIPFAVSILRANYGKLFIILLVVFYSFVSMKKGFSNYGPDNDYFEPYKGVFINTDYERQSVK
ncbi:MAG: EpsG family protein [Bacteroidaceae bacterium]|nr:EpsG family protein [Bacteroidaceae bacterium]